MDKIFPRILSAGIILALVASNLILLQKIDQGKLIGFCNEEQYSQLAVMFSCLILSTLPIFAYQGLIEIWKVFYVDVDYGHLLFAIYKFAAEQMLEKNVLFAFGLLSSSAFGMSDEKLVNLTMVFIIGQFAYILGNIASIYLDYKPLSYPGIIFTYSPSFYLLLFNISKLKYPDWLIFLISLSI